LYLHARIDEKAILHALSRIILDDGISRQGHFAMAALVC
jgi:hypothetical protein